MRPLSVEEGLGNWFALARQWRVGSCVAAAGFVASLAIIVAIQPVYKADVELLLPSTSIADPANRKSTASQADPFVVRSYAEIVVNNDVSQRVIDSLQLEKNQEFAQKPTLWSQAVEAVTNLMSPQNNGKSALYSAAELRKAALLADYQGRLKAVNDGRSLIVELSFQAHDARLAEAVVNAHARTFVDQEIARFREDAEAKTAWMRKELDRTSGDFLKSQEALQLNASGSSILQDRSGSGISALRMRESLAKTTVDVYASVLKRYQDMLADQSYTGSDIKIVSLATLPTAPYFPKRSLCAAVAALVWIILGIGAAALAAVLRDKVSVDAWLKANSQSVLGRVHFPSSRPWLWQTPGDRARKRLFWEEVREVLSAIKVSNRRHPTVLVTSALPKEGKSLVASAIAHQLASTGVKTLLVDINARNVHYKKALGPEASRSCELSNAFAPTLPMGQIGSQVDACLPLFYLGSRGAGQATMPRLSTTKLRAIFNVIKKRFDVVIIDAPAMDGLADALLLTEIADDVILTSLVDGDPQHIKGCIEKIRSRGVVVKGVVVTDPNRVSPTQYSKMLRYPSDETIARVWPVAQARDGRFFWRSLGLFLPKAQRSSSVQANSG